MLDKHLCLKSIKKILKIGILVKFYYYFFLNIIHLIVYKIVKHQNGYCHFDKNKF